MLLYLVRHGHTEYSDSGKIAGVTDVGLSDRGTNETTTLAAGMPEISPELFYSSDLRRTVQTLALLYDSTDAIQDPRLRELDFGEWEGMTWQEVHQRDSDYLQKWSDNWLELAPPAGETFSQLVARTTDWFDDFTAANAHLSDDASVLVTAHSGSIRALICSLLDLPLDRAFRFSIDYSCVTALKISPDGHHQCRFLNSTSLRG